MSTLSTNYNFVKPDYSDSADIMDINGNFDIVDDVMKEISDKADENASDIENLETATTELSTAVESNTSDISSLSSGKQNNLTKGTVAANTNLNDVTTVGTYWLNSTYGNLPHTGSAAGILEVIQPVSTVIAQKYVRFSGTDYAVSMMFYRLRVGGTWYPWKTALVVS